MRTSGPAGNGVGVGSGVTVGAIVGVAVSDAAGGAVEVGATVGDINVGVGRGFDVAVGDVCAVVGGTVSAAV